MITTRQFFARRNLAIIFTITISILLASSVGKGQSVGPNVDECTGGIVDSNTGVEQTVCLYGDASGITGSVEVDDWGGGNSWYWADQVGASGYINSTYINDQCCGGNENVSGSITPQLNTWEYLTGYYDEEVCDQYYNCNWSYGNYGLSVAVEVTGNPPPAPTGLTATAGGGQATLSWTSSSSATSYNVYMGSTSGGEGSSPIFTGITGTSYTVGGLTNGTTYFFEVAAVNSGGTSGLSNEASATPFSGPPSAPTGLTASPGNSLVALSWSASPGATSYNVYRGTSSGGEGSSPIATGITVTAFSSTGVSNGTSYYFRVAAVNSGGTSGYSNEASATPTSALPNGYSYSATYDPVGNVATYNDSVMGSWTFGYDPMNRLKSGQNTAVTGTSAQFLGQNLCWSYDSFGNRTMQALQSSACPAQSSSNSTWVYNANNQVSGVIPPGGGSTSPSPYTYDSAGDVTVDLTTSNQYLFDPEGRICAVRSPNGAGGWIMKGYLYDAEGVRVAKGTITTWGSCDPAINGAANLLTNFYALGPGDEQLTETDGSGNWQHANVWAGGKLLATYDTTGLHFYMDDLLGSRRVQATTAGVTEHDCLSGPYGDFESCLPTPTEHLFTGKERDSESGNDYFGARYYASTMGRWMSPDPSPAGVNVMNPQSWNLYNYALNNPLRMVDRNGYWATDIHAQIVTYSLQNYVSAGELNVLRARQYSMDADQSDQNRHSMANTGQSSQDALNGMWNYVRDEMNIVTSSTVGSGNALNITGVNALGDAIHTLEDYTSPMHTDHAFMPMEWDGGTWPPSKWGPGLNHVLGEQSPDQDWSRIGLAVRLTMAAYLQSGEGCQSGKRCLTADNFEYEFQQNMTEYVNNFYATHNAGASSEAQKEAARQCALGNPAACD